MAGQGQLARSMMHRRNGAIGNRSTPGRIWKNMGMPGHMGDERVTVQNLKVVQVRAEEGVILISGAVPGANAAMSSSARQERSTGGCEVIIYGRESSHR
jgi:large subunit ribosomal protein L3